VTIAATLAEILWAGASDEGWSNASHGGRGRSVFDRETPEPSAPPDQTLLAQLRGEDVMLARTAFAALFRRHTPMVFAAALRGPCQRDVGAAEDAVQTVMLRVWERRTTLPAIVDVGAYLVRAVAHANADRRRSETRGAARDAKAAQEYVTEGSASIDDLMMEDELRAALTKAIGALPGRMGILFRAWWYGGGTYQDVASRFQVSTKAVDQARSWAVQRLRADPSLAPFRAKPPG